MLSHTYQVYHTKEHSKSHEHYKPVMLKRMLNKNKHGGTYKISFYTNKIVIDFKILDFFLDQDANKKKNVSGTLNSYEGSMSCS